MRLGPGPQEHLAVVLADVFGEPVDVARDIAAFVDRYLQRVPPRAALGLRVVVWAIAWMPLLVVGVPLPAHALSRATRERYLARWASSRVYFLREGFYLLKAIALMGWGAHATVRARLGVGPLAAVERA
jgi:hypothetical protein